ncbi:MAG: hypothetical protein J1D86_06620 [Alistipes sp.]|nr:hypothetical protein [Alistipes sp.]
MTSITPPPSPAPLTGPVIFTLQSEQPTLDITLVDADSDTPLAGRRIRTSDGRALYDAAPLLRRLMFLRPSGGETGLFADDDTFFRVRLEAGGAVSPVITCVCAAPSGRVSAITAMPYARTIRYGECDRILFYAPEPFEAGITAFTSSARDVRTYEWNGDPCTVCLRLRTSDFDEDTQRILVTVNGTAAAEYTFAPQLPGSVRAAWRTPIGSVEHVTFPAVVRREMVVDRHTLQTPAGILVPDVVQATETTALSDYDTDAMTAATAGIIASTQVWEVDQLGTYTPVGVLGTRTTLSRFGKPSNMELTLRAPQNAAL